MNASAGCSPSVDTGIFLLPNVNMIEIELLVVLIGNSITSYCYYSMKYR